MAKLFDRGLLNRSEAERVLNKTRKVKGVSGSDLQVSITGSDISMSYIFMVIMLLYSFGSLADNITAPENLGLFWPTIPAAILTSLVVFLSYHLKQIHKLRTIRDYLIACKVQNVEEISY